MTAFALFTDIKWLYYKFCMSHKCQHSLFAGIPWIVGKNSIYVHIECSYSYTSIYSMWRQILSLNYAEKFQYQMSWKCFERKLTILNFWKKYFWTPILWINYTKMPIFSEIDAVPSNARDFQCMNVNLTVLSQCLSYNWYR